jgi:hypothetical protein
LIDHTDIISIGSADCQSKVDTSSTVTGRLDSVL